MKNTFTITAPGRVNLLGEHTDYNGLPVLPMAIERRITITGKRLDKPKVIASLKSENAQESNAVDAPLIEGGKGDQSAAETFSVSKDIPKHPPGHWCNYVKAGMRAALIDFISPAGKNPVGCEIRIAGNIPPNAGLSSSSALVVASALALLRANEVEADPKILAESMMYAEHYVGTIGGGMDQASSLLAKKNHCMKIDFYPLHVTPIPFPQDISVVICHSGVEAKKSSETRMQYNMRALECDLAKIILRRHLSDCLTQPLRNIGGLLKPPLSCSYGLLQSLIELSMNERYTIEELRKKINDDPLLHGTFEYFGFSESSVNEFSFFCGKRFRHVVSDAIRVEEACIALQENDTTRFCELINQGHISARDDMEISCPEIESLVQCARKNGALASRVTGAGFGGCTINIVPKDEVTDFTNRMRQQWYNRGDWSTIDPIIQSRPSGGAAIS